MGSGSMFSLVITEGNFPLPVDTPTTGMLVVECVIPGSPADGKLEAGDVLVRVGRTIVTHFLQLEEVMDSSVGGKVELQLQRGGKEVRLHACQMIKCVLRNACELQLSCVKHPPNKFLTSLLRSRCCSR